MEEQFVLGIDFGSDSVRALVVNARDGKEVATAVTEYPRWKQGLYCDPARNQYRQHPLDYIEALEQCVREALSVSGAETAARVAGIGIDTTGSTPAQAAMKPGCSVIYRPNPPTPGRLRNALPAIPPPRLRPVRMTRATVVSVESLQ